MFNADNGRFQGPREIKVLDSLNAQDANQVVGHAYRVRLPTSCRSAGDGVYQLPRLPDLLIHRLGQFPQLLPVTAPPGVPGDLQLAIG